MIRKLASHAAVWFVLSGAAFGWFLAIRWLSGYLETVFGL